jgi:hypothetical protein
MHVITTHGGTAGALDAQVLKLVQWLKARDDRRYGPEWCMMRIQGGPFARCGRVIEGFGSLDRLIGGGVAQASLVGSASHPRSLRNRSLSRFPRVCRSR